MDKSMVEKVVLRKGVEACHCLNCGDQLTGLYCAACGQKDIGSRLNSRLMVHNLFESLTDLDSRPWRTLIELAKNPGRVALNYIQGARSSYINPIRYIVTTFAIFIGFLAANGWLDAEVVQSVQESTDTGSGNRSELQEQLITIMVEVREIFLDQRDILTFLTVPIYSFLIRWIFFKTRFNFAETLTLVCFVLGQIQLYAFLAALVPFLLANVDYTGTPGIIPFIVLWQGVSGFYGRKRIKSFFMTLVAYTMYSVVSGGVAFGLAMLRLHVL